MKSKGQPAPGYWPTKSAAQAAYREAHPFRANVRIPQAARKTAEAAVGTVLAGAHKAVRAAGGYRTVGAAVADAALLPAVAVAVAGLAGFITGSYIANPRLSLPERQEAVDQAYRVARRRLADQLGRPLTQAELKPLADAHRVASAKVRGGVIASSQLRPGAE